MQFKKLNFFTLNFSVLLHVFFLVTETLVI